MDVQNDWAIIFDVDGTMVDNALYHENAWIELGKRHNIDVTPDYYKTYIHAKCNARNARTLFGDDIAEDFVEKVSDEKETIYRDSFRPVLKEIAGLTALLKQLSEANIPMGVASNSPKGNVDLVLDELNIRHYFGAVLDRDMLAVGKPNPEGLFTVAKQLGIETDRCLVVEDSPSGFKAAENAKMKYIAIAAGSNEEDLKHAATALAIYDDFTTITPEILHGLICKTEGVR